MSEDDPTQVTATLQAAPMQSVCGRVDSNEKVLGREPNQKPKAAEAKPQAPSDNATTRLGGDVSARIQANFARFDADVRLAEAAFARGALETAAFYAATAATVATHKHCGIYASPRLEHLLHEIGARVADPGGARYAFKPNPPFKKVLHVGTELAAVGGLTRMISRWITADAERTNSLVLTSHRGEVPQHLCDSVAKSGGRILRLNQKVGSQLDWVRELRRLAREHDLVVLHIHCEDVIPLIAFAPALTLPPVLFLNHADHIFWLGPSVGHVVINLRDAATDISIGRRGVEPNRNYLLPTIVDPTVRTRSRQEAKAALGVSPDEVLLVSVARGAKYRSMNGVSFADMHVGVLEKHPNARLIVVGSGEPDDWKAAKAKVGGRITGMPEMPDPRIYFEAADIYVDSFPFVSSTSMMEAGGYGSPLLTLFTYPSEARIFGINHVGLVGTALQATSLAQYSEMLERLITDLPFRKAAGEAAREAVESTHAPPGWLKYLEEAYAVARDLPAQDYLHAPVNPDLEHPHFGPPDSLHEDIFGYDYSVPEIKKVYMGALPLGQRLAMWARMRQAGEIRGAAESLRLLMPEWLKRKLQP